LCLKMLLRDSNLDPSINKNRLIRHASKLGLKEMVEELLKDIRVDPAADNNDVIRTASECGHSAVVELLLKDKKWILQLRVTPQFTLLV
jgi:hypothetical protein